MHTLGDEEGAAGSDATRGQEGPQQVKSSPVKSGQVKSSQVKSSQGKRVLSKALHYHTRLVTLKPRPDLQTGPWSFAFRRPEYGGFHGWHPRRSTQPPAQTC